MKIKKVEFVVNVSCDKSFIGCVPIKEGQDIEEAIDNYCESGMLDDDMLAKGAMFINDVISADVVDED